MNRRPPRSTRTYSRVPYTTLFRSILIVIDDIDRDGLDARCLAVLVDIAADVFLAERVEAPEVHRNLVADLADEPFILLERHPVARAPAMVAVAGGVELEDRKSTRLNSSH